MTKERLTGRFLGIPYDWRTPTLDRMKSRMWNADERRLFPPRTWGWGFTVNLYRLFHPRRK